MSFDTASHQLTVAKIQVAADRVHQLTEQIASAPLPLVYPPWFQVPYRDAQSQLRRTTPTLLNRVHNATAFFALPVELWKYKDEWNNLHQEVTAVAGDLQSTDRPVSATWHGDSADSYNAVVQRQAAAAARMGVLADRTQSAMTWAAEAIAGYYAAVLAIFAQMIGGLVAAASATGTVVGAPAAPVMAVASVAKAAAELAGADAMLLAWLQVQQGNLRSEAADWTAFPGGHWPPASTQNYAPQP
jgi:hypothetical protein